MPRPVSYSKEYDRVRMQLTPGEKILVGEVEDRIANDPSPTLPGRFEDHGHIYETAAQDFVRYVSASLKCETRQPLRQGAARAIVIWWAMTG
jgi:hypothetical protein